MRSILLVCTANICRSPMAEGVLRKMLADAGVAEKLEIDSVGTHDYKAGEAPSELAIASTKRRGYDITKLVARPLRPNDLDHFDMVLAMDKANMSHLKSIAPTRCKQKIELLLEYGDKYHGKEIPDPYGGKPKDFELALDMIEDGCRGLVQLLSRPPRQGG
jgi:protein-tyrosine phosphatase